MKHDPKNKAACTLDCLRKATRNASRLFDGPLAKVDLRSTQFSLLVTIDHQKESPISQLAELMVVDRTTLTRNLKPLESRGLVKIYSKSDKRVRYVCLSISGKELLKEASPIWEENQLGIVKKIGRQGWSRLMNDLDEVMQIVNLD